MAALRYFPCPLFPGEVEDFYCTNCHTSCSALSLLVGPHTGHSRIPLSLATQYFPSALLRNANTLLQRLRDEYEQPRAEHMLALGRALEHLKQQREQKLKGLQELRRDVLLIDKELNAVEQRRVAAICHWSRKRQSFADEARKILHGADTLAKAAGLRDPTSDEVAEEKRTINAEARQMIAKELEDVRKLLSEPLELLSNEMKNLSQELSVERNCCSLEGSESDDEAMRFFYAKDMTRRSMGTCGIDTLPTSDTRVVLDELLTSGPGNATPSGLSDPFGKELVEAASECGSVGSSVSANERCRWRDNMKQRERLLHEGLNRCLLNRI
ncbi:hypothetical protein, conserved [Trypanosoma brucei brucei TREU927]|uniref:Uncharacterized protein n=1 Tax=Trypanosoma brucei brucei (strain 927/4 GUTat10.1) TaxID=185431 RepID=Q57ZS3_TRYB2|nr:hypothetical protein, conserved [Trypanosoma brucei brucei TREU927]AAX79093.1 hypothetical protein, conserved [Trypanosoma brucei]AAZ11319.1 hypothetical protein, conserved [Trypanosoma brucei brucei TREU927]